MRRKQRLLVSIRGPVEAIEAAKGGAQIADVEYPASALGTPYPLNIKDVRDRLNAAGYSKVLVSTNIGELQTVRASACQAALGVAFSGADFIKFGLAEQSSESAIYLASTIVRTVRSLAPVGKKLYPAVFVDPDMCRFFRPFEHGLELLKGCNADGILIDTFNKLTGKGLLNFCSVDQIANFTQVLHRNKKEVWIAGSVSLEELPKLWGAGVDVICVRGAACVPEQGTGRFGKVKAELVRDLISTIPYSKSHNSTTKGKVGRCGR
jgi:uncharacterized protein (UPF0264 family)